MKPDDVSSRLAAWLSTQIEADEVRVEGLDQVSFGHSAEMLTLTVIRSDGGHEGAQDAVVRLRPPQPGLLEPYDLERQVQILRALEPTSVRAPSVLWSEPTGEVLGRPFFVMDRLAGTVYEVAVPDSFGPASIRRMTEGIVDQIAAIHTVDLQATGLAQLDDGPTFLERELDRWFGDMRRVQRGTLPALERLHAKLRSQQPRPTPQITLVHGDSKPGNFAFDGDEISAVFDWELAGIGDPMADVAYTELLWNVGVGLPSRPGALTTDEMVERWVAQTGIEAHDRPWYRAFQGYKMAIILLLGSMLVDAGHSDDPRLAGMAGAIPMFTDAALAELGVHEQIDPGPITPRPK